jgi:hypothetical protein
LRPPAEDKVGVGVVPSLSQEDRQNLQTLASFDVVNLPDSVSDWAQRWTRDNFVVKFLGILLTSMLLSLGAPFWYNALKNLIRLRSLIAQKDDDQRLNRQTNADTTAASGGAMPLLLTGERGDLARVG